MIANWAGKLAAIIKDTRSHICAKGCVLWGVRQVCTKLVAEIYGRIHKKNYLISTLITILKNTYPVICHV